LALVSLPAASKLDPVVCEPAGTGSGMCAATPIAGTARALKSLEPGVITSSTCGTRQARPSSTRERWNTLPSGSLMK
jgi:hypothetical protein